MPVSLLELNDFREMFVGDEHNYGVFIPDGTKEENGKIKGKSFMEHGRLLDEHYLQHLEGVRGLGLCPIYDGINVRFAVIDVDNYTSNDSLISTIYEANLPLVPFKSKSGGLHIYLFFSEPVKAEHAIETMTEFRRLLLLPSTTEIFPKQKRLGDKSYGSWINLPYFGEDSRYAIDHDYSAISRVEALARIRANCYTLDGVRAQLAQLPLSDAPPCIQGIHLARTTSFRNNYLLAFGVYAKTKFGDTFDLTVQEANLDLKEPVPSQELETSVLKSLRKKDYSYRCTEAPIKEYCDKKCCQTREYGIGGENVNDLSYGQLVQYLGTPPYYKWTINDVDLIFETEAEIINQNRFRELAFRSIGHLPYRIKESRWVVIINNALGSMIRDSDPINTELFFGGTLLASIGEFLTQRASARTREQILMGKVFHDSRTEHYIFKAAALTDFLEQQKAMRNISKSDLQQTLKSLNGVAKRVHINERNPSCRVWLVPYSAMKDLVDDLSDISPEEFVPNVEDENEY